MPARRTQVFRPVTENFKQAIELRPRHALFARALPLLPCQWQHTTEGNRLLAAIAAVMLAAADTGMKNVAFTGDAGVVSTSGNTRLTTINVGDKLVGHWDGWTVSQVFSVTYGRNDTATTASLWHGALRADRSFAPPDHSLAARSAVFLLTQYDRNTFAGFRRRISPAVGLALVAFSDSANTLSFEAGAGYTWQTSVAADTNRNYWSGRAAAGYHRRIGRHGGFDQHVEVIPDFLVAQDVRINSETSLTAPITGGIAMKAAYLIHFDGLPEPGYRRTDRILTTGIQVSF
ncbi:MAG: DUF481 domain-containing protein [Gemmatimonadales bacterium]